MYKRIGARTRDKDTGIMFVFITDNRWFGDDLFERASTSQHRVKLIEGGGSNKTGTDL